ncbi:hypothetical protein KIW84_056283 [Lathyrus oleraceus]|uniref:Uncharacterized protein n=1 Tax=Pisum sativum TaxID=3888 RepID=A0A9D4X0D6_PEA|nr:hypothetical protein KIW84_056283 [Pisum sativum]
MKYYTKLGRVVTIHGDIEAARRCYDAAVKGQAVVSTKSNCNNKKLKTEDPARGVNAIDLDCRIGLDETEEGRFPKERSLEHPVRPIPDGEFELIPLGDDPERTVKIGKGLPEETREELVRPRSSSPKPQGGTTRPGNDPGSRNNTTLPDGWDLDQGSTSKYLDWQGTQLAMGGPKPRDQGSNNGPGLRYPRAQSPTLRRFPKPRRLTKSSRVRIHTNKYQTQTSTMNDNENIHALKTIRVAEAKYARRPYYNARRPKYIRHAGHDKKNI